MSRNAARIAELNDRARQAMGILCRAYQTPGILALSPAMRSRIWEAVETFNEFTNDNDPYGEHDFGCIKFEDGPAVFWKMDYYDLALKCGSEDPSDPSQTTRVITIMLASEY